jgi:hypothetical protein
MIEKERIELEYFTKLDDTNGCRKILGLLSLTILTNRTKGKFHTLLAEFS